MDEGENISKTSLLNVSKDVYQMDKPDLEVQIDHLRSIVKKELEETNSSFGTLKNRREQGVHKLSAGAQGFLSDFSIFINNYSGIVEIVKAADSQFGGLAWGTLSVFLSVAVRKQEREDEINRAVLEFSRHCPRLKILHDIYPDEDLQRHIAEMYANIILFARSATSYYQRGSVRRIVSLAKPRDEVAQTIEDIQTGLVNIRLDCEALMQHRVYELSRQAEDLKVQLEDVNALLQRRNQERNIKHMTKLRERFQVRHGYLVSLRSYKALLSNAIFQQTSQYCALPTPMTAEKLERQSMFQRWLDDSDAGLLFLSGHNAGWLNQTTLSWLSQVTVLLIEQLRQAEREVAYVLCQTKPLLVQSDKPFTKALFLDLVLQILEKRVVDHQLEAEIEEVIRSDKWNSQDDHDTLQAGIKLLNQVLHSVPADATIVLILDRVDQCQWSYEIEKLRLGVVYVLDALLLLLRDAPCKLKILAISASTSHRPDIRNSLAQRHDVTTMQKYSEILNWNQE